MERRVASLEDYVKTQEELKNAVSYTDYLTATSGETSEDTNDDIKIPELDEKSVSIAQQRLFGQAWAVRSGKMKAEDTPDAVRSIVNSEISDEEIKKFAKTSHEGLPVHVENEAVTETVNIGSIFGGINVTILDDSSIVIQSDDQKIRMTAAKQVDDLVKLLKTAAGYKKRT